MAVVVFAIEHYTIHLPLFHRRLGMKVVNEVTSLLALAGVHGYTIPDSEIHTSSTIKTSLITFTVLISHGLLIMIQHVNVNAGISNKVR